jgi:hypothetical protein
MSQQGPFGPPPWAQPAGQPQAAPWGNAAPPQGAPPPAQGFPPPQGQPPAQQQYGQPAQQGFPPPQGQPPQAAPFGGQQYGQPGVYSMPTTPGGPIHTPPQNSAPQWGQSPQGGAPQGYGQPPQGYPGPQSPPGGHGQPPQGFPGQQGFGGGMAGDPLDAVGGASSLSKLPWFPLGTFACIQIDELKLIPSRTKFGVIYVVAEYTVIQSSVVPAGNRHSHTINLSNWGAGDFKAIVTAAHNVVPGDQAGEAQLAQQGLYAKPKLIEFCQSNTLRGRLLALSTVETYSKKTIDPATGRGKAFTKHNYQPFRGADPRMGGAPPQGQQFGGYGR